MGLFSSLAGAAVSAIGGGLFGGGGSRSSGGGRPVFGVPTLGINDFLNIGLNGTNVGLVGPSLQAEQQATALRRQAFDEAQGLSREELANRQLDLLRARARPEEQRALEALRSNLLGRGRLGVGAAGGLTDARFQPELASLQEGIARADLDRQLAVDAFAAAEQDRLLTNFQSLAGTEFDIRSIPLDAMIAFQAGTRLSPQNQRQRSGFADAFFGSVGRGIGNLNFSGMGNPFSTPPINPGGFSTNDRLPSFSFFGPGGSFF